MMAKKDKYDVYSQVSGLNTKYFAWDNDKTDPTYFEVKKEGNSYKEITLTQDQIQQANDNRYMSYDRAIYSGSQDRYIIEEVYLKTSNGRPELTTDGAYQEKQ